MDRNRRLRLVALQHTLAQIARREAMAALASAVNEETRSTALANRSGDLVRDYDQRQSNPSASELRERKAFVQSLQGVAKQAEGSRQDARDQVAWQVQSLAKAETRAARIEEKLVSAKRDAETARDQREWAENSALARKLQNKGSDTSRT